MKKINLFMLVLLTIFLTAADGCKENGTVILNDGISNPAKYKEIGTSVMDTVKNTDVDNESGLETTGNVLDSASKVLNTVSVIPGVGSYVKPIAIGLGVLNGILGFFMVRDKKKIKVETERAGKAEKIANDYSTAIDTARMEGDDKSLISVEHLEKSMDKDSKAHFNATGATVLE